MKATLTYHSIEDSGSPISVSPSVFAAHVRWLVSARVRVLSLDELAVHSDDAEDAVAITFDDGFLNIRGAVESLLEHGLPATVFVVSGHVGGTNLWDGRAHPDIPALPLLNWTDLEHLVARGAAVEAHTRSHRALTSASIEALDDELLGSLEELETRLGARGAHVAYPYGDVNDAVAARAARYFRFGHTTDFRALRRDDEPLRLPRLDMYYFQAPGALEAWGSPAFKRRIAWCRARRMIRARLLGGWSPRPVAAR